MSTALMESERPQGLDELELEEYEFLIEEQVFPLEEAAIQIHQTNSARTRDGLYDRWIKDSFKSLAKLMPGQYNKQERVVTRSEEHTSELQSRPHLVCRLLLEKKKINKKKQKQ